MTRTSRRRRALAGALLLASLLVAGAAHGADDPKIDPNAEDSRDAWVLPDLMGDIYARQCAVCHGDTLHGAAQGTSLRTDDYLHGDSIHQVVASIRQGYPDKGMPGWEKVLSAEEIRGLALYILEQRDDNDPALGNGTGPPPVVPEGVQVTKHHAYRMDTLLRGIQYPYAIAALPDGRILLGEKAEGLSIVSADGATRTRVTGTPHFHKDGKPRGTTYTGSGWLLDIQLHPDHAENGWIYLSYGDRCEDCNALSREKGEPVTMIHLIRGRIDGATWKDQESIWRVDRKHYRPGHELGIGARIAFDREGYVYLSLGGIDGYQGMQDLDAPFGKVHRVHDDGRIPEDNPHVDAPGAIESTWTVGHRNPQGVDYDGFPIRYAERLGIEYDPKDLTPPTIDWTPSPGISSMVFYRGAAFPKWQNDMLVATLSQNDLYRVVVDREGEVERELVVEDLGRLRDVDVGPDGSILLLVEHNDGSLLVRMDAATAP